MNKRIIISVASIVSDIFAMVVFGAYFATGPEERFLLIPHNYLPFLCATSILIGIGLMVPLYFAEKARQQASIRPEETFDEGSCKKQGSYFCGIFLTLVAFGIVIRLDILENTMILKIATALILAFLATKLASGVKGADEKPFQSNHGSHKTGP